MQFLNSGLQYLTFVTFVTENSVNPFNNSIPLAKEGQLKILKTTAWVCVGF